jgi:hypothetical protein
MDLDFSVSSLLAGFIFGMCGFYLLKEGKKRTNFWFVGIGLGLMIYPYFVSGPWATWGIGIAGLALAYQYR